MDIATARQRLKECDKELGGVLLTVFSVFERDDRLLRVSITQRLRKRARKEGVWLSREMVITLTNAAYGFDERMSRSNSGRDGIFLLDRSFRPKNEMMRKLFDRYIDKPNSGFSELVQELKLKPEPLLPIRLVSHHMRLLGVLAQSHEEDHLVLVDCDRTK